MKTKFLILLLPLFTFLFQISGDNKSRDKEEMLTTSDMLFISSGYGKQIERNVEPKREGFTWKTIRMPQLNSFEVKGDVGFKAFYKNGSRHPVAIQIKINNNYFCVPSPNSESEAMVLAIEEINNGIRYGSHRMADYLSYAIVALNDFYRYDGNYPDDYDEKYKDIPPFGNGKLNDVPTPKPTKPISPNHANINDVGDQGKENSVNEDDVDETFDRKLIRGFDSEDLKNNSNGHSGKLYFNFCISQMGRVTSISYKKELSEITDEVLIFRIEQLIKVIKFEKDFMASSRQCTEIIFDLDEINKGELGYEIVK